MRRGWRLRLQAHAAEHGEGGGAVGDDGADAALAAQWQRQTSITCNELDLANVGAGLSKLLKLAVYAQLIVPAEVKLPRLQELSVPVDAMTTGGLGVLLGTLDVSRSGMTEEAAHRLMALKFARLDDLVLGDAP